MSSSRRLAALATATTVAMVVGLVAPPIAAADPCAVPTASAQAPSSAATTASPGTSSRSLPSLQQIIDVLHSPIGRKPAILEGVSTTRAEEAQVDAAVAPNTTALAAEAPTASTATRVGWVTGPQTNTYTRFRISGTDLGIMWDNGQSGSRKQVLIAFGDTFGDCLATDQEWRKNTLFRSSDADLADGMTIPNPIYGDPYSGSPVLANNQSFSRQVIQSLGLAATEVTVIPTAGISVGTRQYVNFMSVSQWGNPGQWSTNFSAVAVSDDNGETWTVPQSSIRPSWFNTVPNIAFVWGYQNFQMAAYLRYNGYVYNYGTGAGRGGMPFLARVPEAQVADRDAYEYYTPFGWIKSFPFLALQVVWAPGSEMSVAWNDYLQKFVMLYTNSLNDVVMRTADKPEGPWSSATTLLSSSSMTGGIYAPFIHPWSSGNNLYFTLSLWENYSVMLMRATLSK